MAEELSVPGPVRPSVVSSLPGVYSLPGGVIGDELGRQVESSVGRPKLPCSQAWTSRCEQYGHTGLGVGSSQHHL